MIKGIVVTHGRLGEELLDTAKKIFGDFSGCHAVSNSSKSAQVLIDELEAILPSNEATPCILFVDFSGGSCSYACLKFQQCHRDIPIVSGVNLPLFLAFLNKRDEVPFEKLSRELVKRGQNSIKIVEI